MSAAIEPVPWIAPSGAAPLHAGLGSRAELLVTLAAAIPAVDPSHGLLLLALDVDDFRRFNAERGYAAGDLLLADLGRRLAELGRAFALGADAFALVLDGSPEELWRRGAAALWSLDPRGRRARPALLVRRRCPRRPGGRRGRRARPR